MFKTYPLDVYDVTLRPLLWLIWESWSKKRSHFWMWKPVSLRRHHDHLVTPEPDETAEAIHNWWSNFRLTNWGWQKTTILRVNVPAGKTFQIGFVGETDRSGKGSELFCTMEFSHDQLVAVLLGPERASFFAWETLSRCPQPIEVVGYATRHTLPKNVVLI